LRATFSDALKYGLEEAVLVGNGVGRPQGMLVADAVVTVAKEGSQTADTFVRENAIKMLSRLHPGLVRSAVWVANPTLLPQLLELQFTVDNAAGSDYVGGAQEPVLVAAGEYRLFGIPLVFSEAMPVLGDLNDIALVAPSEYVMGTTVSMSLETTQALRFDYDQTTFRLITRVDGAPLWSSAMSPRNGDTLSFAVNLAERG
jgi:HK97 family phage major capsid protein